MKKLFIFTTLLFISLTYLQAQNSNMVFFTEKGEKFTLFINGNQQNQTPLSNVKVEQMPSNIYQVRVEFEDKTNGSINDKISINPGSEKTWKIRLKDLDTRNKVNNGLNSVGLPNATNTETKFVIKALSEIPISTNMVNNYPNQQQTIIYQPEGYGYSNNTNIPNNGLGMGTNIGINSDPNGNVSMNVNVNGMGTNVNTNGMNTQTNTSYSSTNTNTSYSSNSGYQINNTGHVGCNAPLPSNLFLIQKNKVRAQKTEAGRLITCKKIINTQCLTSQQVFELVSLLTFSNNRLDAAKLAYTRTFDPDNYEVVFNAFTISSAVEDLNNYIQTVNASWGTTVTTTTTTNPNNNNWNNNQNNNQNNNWNNNNQNNNNSYVPDYTGPIGCPRPMATSAFETAKKSISSNSFENTKLEVAKQIMGQNCLTSEQVLQVTKLFGFENTKLEFAKFAYSHTYDKGNYFKVNDAFTFESSKSELIEFIKGE
jgi:hypothetical protein